MSHALPKQLEVQPISAFDAHLRLPGSKSLTNRALLLAALADGESNLSGVLFSDDTRAMLDALGRLGFDLGIDEANQHVRVTGAGGKLPKNKASLHLGNAGTATRFLTAACCLKGAGKTPTYDIDGIERMRQRPIGQLVDPLRGLGAVIEYSDQVGYPPLRVHGRGLAGGEILLGPTLSSQYISALLQVGPYCDKGLTIQFEGPVTSRPYVEMTLGLMERFGARGEVDQSFSRIHVEPGPYKAADLQIEPDASNATYFLAAAALIPESQCTIEALGRNSLQGDVGFAQVLEKMGALVDMDDAEITVCGPTQGLSGIDVDLNHMPDTAQTLAAVAVFAKGATTIRNVGNLRVKETDRLAAMQKELTKLGATVLIHGDDITIEPPREGGIRPAAIDTYDDHRMAMSFAVIGLRTPGITINDPGCVAKTFPDFFQYLTRLKSTAGAAE